MECDSQNCKDAGKLCDALGVQYVADIEIEESKEPLEDRVNKSQRIKNQQMKFYADDENFKEVMKKRGPWKEKHYYVMGQDITNETAAEIANTLIIRDGPQFLELTAANADQIGAMFVPESYLPSTKFVSPEMKEEVLKENPDDTKLFGEKIANDGEIGLKFPIKISQILERPLNIKYYAKKAFSTSFLLLLVLKTVDFTTDLALNVRYYDQLEEAFYQYFPNKGSCHENSPMACHFTGKDRMDSSTFFYVSLSIFLLTYFAELMFMTFYNGSKHYRATLIGYCCWENLTRNKQWIKLPAWFIISAVNYITGLWYESFMQKFTKYWIFTYDEMKQGIDINGCEYCQNCPQRETCICVHCGRNANNAAKGKLQQFSNTGTSLCHFVIYPPY